MEILVLDDHALFRAGLRLLLATIEPDAVILESATVPEAGDLARAHPDLAICLVDLHLTGAQGVDAVAHLKAAAPDAAVVVVSAEKDPATIRACIDAGAMSFVPKSMPPVTLTLAIRHVLAGRIYLPEELLQGVSVSGAAPVLSPRQLDVLRGLARGLPTKSVARELNISENTAKEHIGLLFHALGVHNRTEAVIKAARLGLPGGHPPPLQRTSL